MPAKKLQVFISSTYLDLKDERQAAVAAILKAGHIPAGMELFTAGDKSQWETIKRWIEESDLYMLILGGRYGSVHPDTGLSYTEMEYDYATEKKKPLFAVVVEEKALDEKIKIRGREILEQQEPKKLHSFRAKVLSRMSSFYRDEKDIRLAVHESIPTLDGEYNMSGWIRGSEVADTKPLLDELARISEENRNLRLELERARSTSAGTASEADEFRALAEELESKPADLKVQTEAGVEHCTNLLQAFRQCGEYMITPLSCYNDVDMMIFNQVGRPLCIYEITEIMGEGVMVQTVKLTSKGKRFLRYARAKHSSARLDPGR